MRNLALASLLALLTLCGPARSDEKPVPAFDPALAKELGADERGMRSYVLVVLKTGPHRVPDGPKRDEMFKGHFANIKRLADEQKLAIAGPFDGKNEWRGLFILAVDTQKEAEALVATDPVIVNGEMVAEYHQLYASAALMAVPDIHARISPK